MNIGVTARKTTIPTTMTMTATASASASATTKSTMAKVFNAIHIRKHVNVIYFLAAAATAAAAAATTKHPKNLELLCR